MAHITREQVQTLIRDNARDFWTIVDENMVRLREFDSDEKGTVKLTSDNLVSICITQFIQLKNNKNFGSVKIHSKDDKPNPKPEEEPKVAEVEEENEPVQDSQLRTLETKVAEHPQGENIKNQYLKDLNKETVRGLTRKECYELIVVHLHQKKDSMYDSGGD